MRRGISLVLVLLLLACKREAPVEEDAGAEPDLESADAAAPQPDGPVKPAGPPPSIDGQLDDWSAVPTLATDAEADATGGLDVTSLKATSRGALLYLSFGLVQTVNAYSGPASEGTLRLELGLPLTHLTVDFRAKTIADASVRTKTLSWSEIGWVGAPTVASDRFEVRLDLSRFGVKPGDTVKVDFSGSDSLASPGSFKLVQPAVAKAAPRSTDRQSGTTVRLASLNTYHDGLTVADRGPIEARLVKAMAADVYLFQEAINTTDVAVAGVMKNIDPHGDGVAWNVVKVGDRAIASRAKLYPLPVQSGTQAFAAAALELGGKRLTIFTLRTVCCGFTGDSSDQARLQQMKELAATIGKLRAASLGAELAAWRDAPVFVMGDWNLVGSRAPLDLMLDPSGPGLVHWQLRHLRGDDVYTWRSDTPGEFPPGMLDLLTHSSKGVTPLHGFILDTSELEPAALAKLGLQAEDSRASDHLMLVADFRLE